MSVIWKYEKPLGSPMESILALENKWKTVIPKLLAEDFMYHNGAQPDPFLFNSEKSAENIFGALLSLNSKDKTNIYLYSPFYVKKDFILYPFGIDPFGNLICFSEQGIWFFNHEKASAEYVSESYELFKASLFKE